MLISIHIAPFRDDFSGPVAALEPFDKLRASLVATLKAPSPVEGRSDNVVSRTATLLLRFRLRSASYGGLIASAATPSACPPTVGCGQRTALRNIRVSGPVRMPGYR